MGSAYRKVCTYIEQEKYNNKKLGHITMPRIGFEHVIPASKRSKTESALHPAAFVID